MVATAMKEVSGYSNEALKLQKVTVSDLCALSFLLSLITFLLDAMKLYQAVNFSYLHFP